MYSLQAVLARISLLTGEDLILRALVLGLIADL